MYSIFILVLGFTLLILGADKFVAGASALAARLGLPSLLIGLTVVAFGTSAPELAVSITAGLSGSNEIVIGNVLGSNFFNLLMIAGVSAILHPLIIEGDILHRDWQLSLFSTALLGGLIAMDGYLSRLDGLLLLLVFTFVLFLQIFPTLRKKSSSAFLPVQLFSPLKIALFSICGLVAIIIGSRLAVNSAVSIAQNLGLSETFIGLTIVAMGTSLPELVTSVVATRKGEHSIAMGNIIGSNLFNILLVLGFSASITPMAINGTAVLDCLLLFFVTAALYFPARFGQFKRPLGILMVCSYVFYTIWLFIR